MRLRESVRRRAAVLLIWLLGAGPLTARAEAIAAQAARPPGASLDAIPTRRDDIGRVLAPVLVNGAGPFHFMVDTGASRSTISPQLVEQLQLGRHPSALLHGVTGAAEVDLSRIDTLEVGQLRLQQQELPIVTTEATGGFDGILGVAGLRDECVVVDFRRDLILITDAGSCPTQPDYVKVPLQRLQHGVIAVRGQVGRVRVQAIIDTGAEHTLGNLALRAALLGKAGIDASAFAAVYGTTGAVTAGELREAPPIVLGRVATLSHVQVVFGDYHVFSVWGLDRQPALLLGMDALGSFEGLVIDLKRGVLHLRAQAAQD